MKKIVALVACLCLFAGYYAHKRWERVTLWWALQGSLPAWAKDQIEQDLNPFGQTGISQVALDETFQKVASTISGTYRYRIVDGHIYRKPEQDFFGRATAYDKMLQRIQRSHQLPNVDFIICFMDGVPEGDVPSRFWITEHQAPLLCWAKKKGDPALVLVPDFLTTLESDWQSEVATVEEKYRLIPWEQRTEKAFWRGAASDKIYTAENYVDKPRYIISLISSIHPHLVDAGFCGTHQNINKLIPNPKLIVGHTPVAGHLAYKYLPVLDGWMCTSPGYQWRLLSGSVSFKQESDEVQYFYSALKPFVHYVPIQNNMGDLLEKIDWAKNHDAECRIIAENARAFAKKNLMPNQIYCYLYRVLEKYSSLQTFDYTEIDSSWKHVD